MRTRNAIALLAVGALLGPIALESVSRNGNQLRSIVAHAAASGIGAFVVFYADDVTNEVGRAAVAAAGGRVVDEITELGVALVETDRADFAQAAVAGGAIEGVTRNHSVGNTIAGAPHRFADERALEDRAAYSFAPGDNNAGGVGVAPTKPGPETFSSLQWDMAMIGATADGAHRTATGRGVLVGIIDTGIDGSHPDLVANFNAALSRNFTRDIPAVDGPCENEPDQSCDDPANIDEGGHGTHVAGIVAAAANGFGIAGVAPDATLVNIRAGQDSGYFFLFETLRAITYAANAGIDVVNMSFFTDPWLYNCDSADDYVEGNVTADDLSEQAQIRESIIEAVAFAYDNGVTLVASSGNEHSDLAAATRVDNISPNFPLGMNVPRTVTNDCLNLPPEAPGVIAVSALGPSGNKADYSTWGFGNIDVSAPGGWFRDGFGTRDFREPTNMVLSTYPRSVAVEEGGVNPGGGLYDPHFYKRDCTDGHPCAYYQYLQGTSMAAPHVTGLVALIIQAHGLDHNPAAVYEILTSTATDTSCPDPVLLDYTDEGRPADWTATCTGDAAYNSIYGHGIVNAEAAVAIPTPTPADFRSEVFEFFDKSGNRALEPLPGDPQFAGFGGAARGQQRRQPDHVVRPTRRTRTLLVSPIAAQTTWPIRLMRRPRDAWEQGAPQPSDAKWPI